MEDDMKECKNTEECTSEDGKLDDSSLSHWYYPDITQPDGLHILLNYT